jgi:Flp pilus assembly protein TadG
LADGTVVKKRRRASRGSSIVEFALCLPFLVIFVLGTIDGARLYSTWNRTKHAAQQGANYAQFYPLRQTTGATCTDPSNINARVHNEGSDLTVNVYFNGNLYTPGCAELASNSSVQPGDTVSVKVTAPFSFLTPFAQNLWGSPTVKATAKITVQG